ncbi:MAG: taurine dioxygenase [Acidimicrobiales bacterium]|nr:taurine dioxygenase [Acidimicrobiales bacterium]
MVEGVDLRTVTPDGVAEIEAALLEHLVLFFPGQALEPTEQMRFAQMLGEIDVAPFGPKHPDVPEMTVLDQKSPKGEGADAWHSDNSFRAEPPSYTMLQSVLLPPHGGDTCWSNMYEAYAALSEPMQRFLEPLTATHDLSKMLELAIARGNSDADLGQMRAAYPPEHHPVVRTHPQTGRRALFVNGNFTTRIDGLEDAESAHVLDLLLTHVKTPDFQCRFRWLPGTLALWDNRCLQHYAVPDYTSRRVMHRLTLSGDKPV